MVLPHLSVDAGIPVYLLKFILSRTTGHCNPKFRLQTNAPPNRRPAAVSGVQQMICAMGKA
jgi:hypothetical protein